MNRSLPLYFNLVHSYLPLYRNYLLHVQTSKLECASRHQFLSSMVLEVEKGELTSALQEVERCATVSVESQVTQPRQFTDQLSVGFILFLILFCSILNKDYLIMFRSKYASLISQIRNVEATTSSFSSGWRLNWRRLRRNWLSGECTRSRQGNWPIHWRLSKDISQRIPTWRTRSKRKRLNCGIYWVSRKR